MCRGLESVLSGLTFNSRHNSSCVKVSTWHFFSYHLQIQRWSSNGRVRKLQAYLKVTGRDATEPLLLSSSEDGGLLHVDMHFLRGLPHVLHYAIASHERFLTASEAAMHHVR